MVTNTVTPRVGLVLDELPEEAAVVRRRRRRSARRGRARAAVQRAEREPGALADAGGQVLGPLASRRRRARSARAARPSASRAPRRRGRRGRRRTRRSRAATGPGRGSPSAPCSRCGRARGAGARMTSMPSTSIVPGRRLEQADQHADRRALAGAVGAEEREDRPGLDRDGRESSTAVKSPKRLVRPRVADDRRAHACRSARAPSSVDSMSTGSALGEADARRQRGEVAQHAARARRARRARTSTRA